MAIASLALALLALAAPVRAAPMGPADPEGSARSDASRFSRVYLHVRAGELAPVRDAIALRVPHVELLELDGAVPSPEDDSLVALVDVGPSDGSDTELELTIIVSDGRAFDRRLEIGPDEDRARVVAGAVAHLLVGIEAGTVPPDRGDVPMSVTPPVSDTATTACPSCPRVEPCPEPERPPERPRARPPTIDTGLRAGVPVVLGLGAPADADRYAGAGVELATITRLRAGAFLGGSVRLAGRGLGDAGLVRARFGLGAGYVLRRRALELEASAWVTAEPWSVRDGLASARFVAGATGPSATLLGGAARLAPGLRWAPSSRRVGFRFGAWAEAAVSGMPARGFEAARITVASPREARPPVRVGGVELALGLELAAWWSIGPRR